MYRILYKANVSASDIRILDCDTRLLVDDSNLIGFYTGEVVGDMYNIHHFYIKECYRKYKIICDLIMDFNNRSKELGCQFILLHIRSNTGEKRFFMEFYGNKIVSQYVSNIEGIEMYKVEVL